MIKKIEIKGLRGKSFDIELEPITLVIGENTKGKTTIADAIRWGLLGYIPGMPQPPRGWAELIGSGETGASVRIEHVDGSRIQRSINLEKGAVKIAGSGIEEEGFNLNLLTLDPAQFFAATGPVRAQMVAEAASGGFDWNAQLPDRLRRFGWEGHSEWPDWIGRAIERAKQERSLSADKKKTLTATLRGLEGIRGIVVGDDTGAKEALAKGQQALGGLKEQLRAVDAQIGKVNLPQPNPAQGQLDAVTRALQEFLGKTHDEATFAERLKDCQERLQMLKLTEGEPPDQRTLAKWRSDLVKLSNDEAVAQSRVKLFKEGAKTIEAKYAKLRKLGQCPTCGTSGKALEGALAKAEKFELAQHKAQLKEAEDKWTQTGQAHEELETKCKEAEEAIEKRSELEMELAELGEEAKLIELWKEHERLLGEVKQQGRAEVYDIEALQERRYDISCQIEEATEAVQQLEKALAEITYKRSQKRQLAEIEAGLEEAEKCWKEANSAVAELDTLRERWTAASLDPVLTRMTVFSKGIFDQPLSLEGSELGRMVGNRWVPLTQFSGSEQAVAVAALTCALSSGDQQSVVLADELSSFDDEHLVLFLKNVVAAFKAGVLKQFIGFSTPRSKVAIKGVTIKTL